MSVATRCPIYQQLQHLKYQYLQFVHLQVSAEKLAKTLEQQLGELNSKLEESASSVNDLGGLKAKMQAENAELLRQLEEAESQLNQLNRQKQQLAKQLEETKTSLEEEARHKHKLQTEARNLHADMETLR